MRQRFAQKLCPVVDAVAYSEDVERFFLLKRD
ncbi:hypothetical protein JGUZn3_02610 [Entomobacter blattae]|uniref:Uncharacterized protein n=1 Tax=Entomobacter blattae TaxID=2762277 RepID=A0A7H1NP09_9PROT|nr:hypothetical protein JGUZn3_02610 [Entomobacter blattae]